MKLGSEVERRVVKIGELAVKPEKAIPAMTGIVRNVGWWECYWKGTKALYVGLTTIKHSNIEANRFRTSQSMMRRLLTRIPKVQ